MNYFIYGVVTLLASMIGAYYGAYLKKKGENLATHEDISNLVEEVKAVTTATKNIEAEISTGVWDRQKRWEMKREVLFSAAKVVAEVEKSLSFFATLLTLRDQPDNLVVTQARMDRIKRWQDTSARFDGIRSLVAIVCERDTKGAFDLLATITYLQARAITRNEEETYRDRKVALNVHVIAVRDAMRKELGVDDLT